MVYLKSILYFVRVLCFLLSVAQYLGLFLCKDN